MKKILVVVDMQNDFVTGSLGSEEAQEIVPIIKEKIEVFRKEGRVGRDFVVYTRDTHYYDYLDTLEGKKLPVKHCIHGTSGWCIIDELKPEAAELVFNKITFGSIPLAEITKSVVADDDVYIELCGVCTDICVISNALLLRAYFPNATIIVDAKACAGTTPEKHQAALEVMKSCQIDVIE